MRWTTPNNNLLELVFTVLLTGNVQSIYIRQPMITDINWMFYKSAYNNTSMNAAVNSLNVAVQCAIDQSLPCGSIRKTKYHSRFSSSLRYYIRKKNCFHKRCSKKNITVFIVSFQNTIDLSKLPSDSQACLALSPLMIVSKYILKNFGNMCSHFKRIILLESSYTLTDLVLMILVMLM